MKNASKVAIMTLVIVAGAIAINLVYRFWFMPLLQGA